MTVAGTAKLGTFRLGTSKLGSAGLGIVPTPPVYIISGTVTGDVIAGVTVDLTGTVTDSTVTDANGDYSFSGLLDGAYTVTPSLEDYTFAPTNSSVNVAGSDVTVEDFVATADAVYLFDTYPGLIAVSIWQMITGQTLWGRVRRSSDDEEQDINIVNGLADTAAILTFCGMDTGYVVRTYNPGSMGAAGDATESIGPNQPVICAGGAIKMVNGKPAFNTVANSGRGLKVSAFAPIAHPITIFSVTNSDAGGTRAICSDLDTGAGENVFYYYSGAYVMESGSGKLFGSRPAVGQHVNTALFNSTASEMYEDGVKIGTTQSIGSNTWNGLQVFRGNSGGFPSVEDGQELLFYSSDQLANRVAIEADINARLTA